ncbi:MAG: 2-oxoglutarate dehydrogenase E1 component, partial [Rhizobiales bacterium]|nr:2-oxoglutarate dehydrogenase E1 component [Hyphomicrobiales bacterium]
AFTQPAMYKRIGTLETVAALYAKRLIAEGVMTEEGVEAMKADYRRMRDEDFSVAEGYKANKADWLDGRWAGMKASRDYEDPRKGLTGVPVAKLKEIGLKLTKVPKSFKVHRTLQRVLDGRRKTIEDGVGLDWAMGEHLAFATLVTEGNPVRLSGQDVQRGTFSQRHAVLVDQDNEKRYTPVNHLVKDQKVKLDAINSMLSEEAVLGFEYGYSLAEPNTLVIWEAQFGDFANGAQVVFDQFISSGERKWLRMSGLVCLLPHGYEGQGPEHSSARLERFLQMCAEDNMQVANCTTPANYFHILRRQMKRDIRKPLIIMTPKSLLRHKRATSKLAEMGEGTSFHRLLWDDAEILTGEKIKLVPDAQIRRVVMCSGKVYYDLYEEREKRGLDDIYLLRIEQLYPWPHKALILELARFKGAEFVWCQEEPYNMGAWTFAQPNIERVLEYVKATNTRPRYAGRPASASTATGLMSRHLKELKTFLEEALGERKN